MTTPTGILFSDPQAKPLSTVGLPQAGAYLIFYLTGTTTPAAVYADGLLTTPLSQVPGTSQPSCTADSAGRFNPIYLNPSTIYRVQLFTALGAKLEDTDPYVVPGPPSQASLAQILFPITAAETSAGLTIVNFAIPPYPINVLRYGIVPNSVSSAGANATILQALLNYNTTGPVGLVIFPNTTGADTYFFTGVCTIRPFMHIDLCGCTISITGSSGASDVNTGFFYAMSDVVIENGTITTAVNTTSGNNAAACIQIGARGTGAYFTVEESSFSPTLGRVTLRNLTLINNNTGGNSLGMIQMLGGLSNVVVQDVTINCNSIAGTYGVYYEWGYWSGGGGSVPSSGVVTTHAKNMTFENLRILNAGTAGLGLTGCYNCVVDGLYTNGCAQAFIYSVGQAMFFNVSPNDTAGAKRNMTLRNLVGQGCTGTAVQLTGSNASIGGVPANAWQNTDLMTFSVDGIAMKSAGACLVISGSASVRNGKLDSSGTGLNPVTINDDVLFARLERLEITGGTGAGVRCDVAGTGVWSPARQKFIEIDECFIHANVTAGIELNNVASANISRNIIGDNTLYSALNEASQVLGVLVDSGCNGVVCDSNYCTQASSGNSYSITSTASSGCNIVNPLGTVTYSGQWEFNGVANATGTNLAAKANVPNIGYKYFGKLCVDSTTNKMFVAQGGGATSAWISTDGVTTITPA